MAKHEFTQWDGFVGRVWRDNIDAHKELTGVDNANILRVGTEISDN